MTVKVNNISFSGNHTYIVPQASKDTILEKYRKVLRGHGYVFEVDKDKLLVLDGKEYTDFSDAYMLNEASKVYDSGSFLKTVISAYLQKTTVVDCRNATKKDVWA